MIIFKKLIFVIPFLIFLAWFYFQLNFFFKDVYLIFGLNITTLYQLAYLAITLGLASLFFIIFCALANDWKFILPVSILGSLLPIAIFTAPSSLIIFIGSFLSLTCTYLLLSNKLKTYLTYSANTLLTPSVKTLAGFLILTSSLAFYFSAQAEIKTNGFKIPDSLIDTALKFATPQIPDVKGESIAQVSLTPEQIELLKQNPDLLRNQGIDPAILDSLPVSNSSESSLGGQQKTIPGSNAIKKSSNDLVKNLIQSQIQNLLKPYLNLIPVFLAAMFFITLHSFHSLLAILYPILITLTFWIFEKTGFIHFEKEMREVKKIVV